MFDLYRIAEHIIMVTLFQPAGLPGPTFARGHDVSVRKFAISTEELMQRGPGASLPIAISGRPS